MRRSLLLSLLFFGFAPVLHADLPSQWKNYENPLVGVRMRVKRDWGEVSLRETNRTGSITFQISSQYKATVAAIRQEANPSYDVWISSEGLSQLYEPGYKVSGPVTLAGRKAMKVVGISKEKDPRREETYFFDHPPYVDQITFSAPEDVWSFVEPDFARIRPTIEWIK